MCIRYLLSIRSTNFIQQNDRNILAHSGPADIPQPVLEGSLYVRWAGRHGFGVFLGTSRVEAADHRTEPITADAIVASYGGLVCPYEEADNKEYLLNIPGVGKLYPYAHRPTDDKGAYIPVLDATTLTSGDGAFLNNSCCPTLETAVLLNMFEETETAPAFEKKPNMRNTKPITFLFHPARYVLFYDSLICIAICFGI